MAGLTVLDATGAGTPKPPVDAEINTGLTRLQTVPDDDKKGTEAADIRHGNEAKAAIKEKDYAAANKSAANIRDPQLRELIFIAIRQAQGELAFFTTAAAQFEDGTVGVKDPNGLFFMLIFYLTERAPQFNWSDILKSASTAAGSDFQRLSSGDGGDSLFPLPTSQVVEQMQVESQQNKQEAKQNTAQGGEKSFAQRVREALDKSEKKVADRQKESEQKHSEREQEGIRRAEKVEQDKMASVVWPFQNMPVIESGWSKSVEWGNGETQAITFAEPIRTNDGGASAIELDVQFVYAVGVPGMGPQGHFPWTVEEIMGIIYLATSLVYPYRSVLFRSNNQEAIEKQKKAQAQFPVLFLRHYSLFPFLTPFVVSQVQIQPDESQPLIITEPQRLNGVPSHLTIPAVRQKVTITLSKESVDFFKNTAKKHNTQYQRIIRRLSDVTYGVSIAKF